jgi:hypothetical protein
MKSKGFLIGFTLTWMAAAAVAKEAPPLPDADLLEYLGTFETAGGNMVDPMDLKELPPPKEPPQPTVPDKKAKEKRTAEKPSGKEAGDE